MKEYKSIMKFITAFEMLKHFAFSFNMTKCKKIERQML